MKKNKFIIGGGVIAVAGIVSFAIIFIASDNFYSKRVGIERAYNKIFYFAQNQTAHVLDSLEKDITQIIVPFHPQEHALTCETAALRMSLNYYGMGVTEEELLKKLSFSATGSKTIDNIWGDPDLGFVGNIDGSVFKGTGYGVYDKPIRDLAEEYRSSFVMEKAELGDVLQEVKDGRPVIVWGLLSRRKPIMWQTKEGKKIEAHPGEHARVIVGFYGTTSNPTKIILMDPIYGKIRMSKEKFLSDWKIMENRAVVIR